MGLGLDLDAVAHLGPDHTRAVAILRVEDAAPRRLDSLVLLLIVGLMIDAELKRRGVSAEEDGARVSAVGDLQLAVHEQHAACGAAAVVSRGPDKECLVRRAERGAQRLLVLTLAK